MKSLRFLFLTIIPATLLYSCTVSKDLISVHSGNKVWVFLDVSIKPLNEVITAAN